MSPLKLKKPASLITGLSLGAALMLTLPAVASPVLNADEMVVDRFSGEADKSGMPEGWKPFEFPRKHKLTEYSVVRDGENCYLKAVSVCSASAIYKEVRTDLKEFPYLSWRWKVDGILEKGDETKKEGDDFPARVYVTFEEDPKKISYLDRIKRGFLRAFLGKNPPGNAINYVWAGRLKKNEAFRSPFTDNVVTVAVESGSELVGRWVPEERNVYEDYRNYFKSEPPKVIAIAVMTDSDNTQESATGYYADIVFRKNLPGLNALDTHREKDLTR